MKRNENSQNNYSQKNNSVKYIISIPQIPHLSIAYADGLIRLRLSYCQRLAMKQEIHKVHVSNSIPAHIDPVQRQDILWGGVTDWIKSTEFAVNRTLADQEMSLQKTRKTELFLQGR